jgi:hypothetical protein
MPKHASPEFTIWKREVDKAMLGKFKIDTVDVGLDETELRSYQMEFHAAEFVDWLGKKYDLASIEEYDCLPNSDP